MEVKALFFDIDGTLVSFATHRMPRSAAEAVAAARARGIRTFIATGRMPSQVAVVGGLAFDGYITCNGGCCFDGAWNVLSRTPLPGEDIRRLLAWLDAGHELTVTYMYEDRMTVNRNDEKVLALMRQCGVETPVLRDPYDALHEPVYQASIFVGPDEERRLMRELFPACVSSRWHPAFADINSRGCDKRTGMDTLLAHYGIPLAATMAFGDGGNDIPMLRHAAVGVAMGEAAEAVRAAADHVAPAVDDDGIARTLERYGVIDPRRP